MNRISLCSLFILTMCFESAFAFNARDQRECGEINPEMAHWFQARPNSEAPINLILGPLKNQKVGWCFAYTAADMFSVASHFQISGAHVAKNYYAKNFIAKMRSLAAGRYEGGKTIDALKENLDTPLCDEKSFSSNTYTSYATAKKKSCTSPVTELNNFQGYEYKATGWSDGHTLFPRLDSILSDGRIAGIEYDRDQLINDKTNDYKQTISRHASSIVSRYFDKAESSCRYIIRDSFGKTCQKINSKKTKCFEGYYSVTESQLNKMLVTVISLKSK
jgi:hypothetical protein